MSLTDDLPVARGALAGAFAWLAGYLVVYVWKASEVAEAVEGIGFVSRLLGGEAVPPWKGVGWLFLNAHYVDVRFPTIAGGTRMLNFVTASDYGNSTALLVVPPLVLLVAGFAVGYARRDSSTLSGDPVAGAKAGATVALGYLPVSVAAGFLTGHAVGNTEATIAPDPVTAILVAGLVYPLVFGALGGAASGALD